MRFLAVLLLCSTPALAQHNHSRGHDDYKAWSSGKVQNCCNNKDCRGLNDDEWREGAFGIEVKINGTFCRVRPEHFIRTGKSPDWNVPHACIGTVLSADPCDKLLCFAGRGGI